MTRRLYLAVSVMVFVLMLGVSYAEECPRLGVRDCKPGSQAGVCYWRECQQSGSLMQMIFTGETCTCPSGESDIKSQLSAGAQCADQKLIEDVEECSLAVQSNFTFEAYIAADCKVHVKGDPQRKNRSYFAFDNCIRSKGQPIKSWERE